MHANHSDDSLTTGQGTSEPRDGGARAWCTLLGGYVWLALFATFGYASSFGVYQDLYTRAGTSSSSNISWIGSVHLFIFVAMGLPAGKLVDKGYFRHIILAGSFINISSLFVLSFAHIDRYYQIFLTQGVGVGLGSGLIYLPSMVVQTHHWRARRALAMGFVITGSSVGGIVYPIMLNHLFHGPVGFAWGVRASAFLNLGLLIMANLLMSGRHPSDKNQLEKPKSNVQQILRDSPFILMVIGGVLVVLGLFFPYFYLQLFTVLKGISPNFAFYTLTIQNGASIFGRIIPNLLAEQVGLLNTLIFVTLGTAGLAFSLFGITNVGGVTAFAILYGFFSGAVLSLFSPVIAAFASDVDEIGVRMGLGFFVSSFAYLLGPPISGALLTNQNHWLRPIIFNGTIILAGLLLLVVSRFMQARRKMTMRV
ncbi:major facilitator superfamily domain-containing protein [Gautieria morchelliformis]|nr:major facilitator superfamily domain-containing protein [Gautieria morchelliformis]